MHEVDEVEAVPGSGLQGDRYAATAGTFQKNGREASQEVTLIETEAIAAAATESSLPINHLSTRRNLLTEGVRLNDLVGKTFSVGSVVLRGMRLCHPCGHLEKLTWPGMEQALKNRGGLRAQIVEGGTIRVGDAIDVRDGSSTPSPLAPG